MLNVGKGPIKKSLSYWTPTLVGQGLIGSVPLVSTAVLKNGSNDFFDIAHKWYGMVWY